MNEIIENLYVGSHRDGMQVASENDWEVFFVHEQYGPLTPPGAIWRPFVESHVDTQGRFVVSGVDADRLASLIQEIKMAHDAGGKVLVHCAEGIERAPLATTCYLYWNGHADSLEDAFTMIWKKRSEVVDRLHWLTVEPGGWQR